MIIHNREALIRLHTEAGWRPGDDFAAIYEEFSALMRQRADDAAADPGIRRRAAEDLDNVARLSCREPGANRPDLNHRR